MKRYVRAYSEVLDTQKGFLFEFKNYALFYVSDSQNITDKIARVFINKVCDIRGVGDSIRNSALYDAAALKDFKHRIDKAELVETRLGNGKKFYTIRGNGFSLNFPEEDFQNEVIILN